MIKRISPKDSKKINILALTGEYTYQDIVEYFNNVYTKNQILYHLKNKYPEAKKKIKRESSSGNVKIKNLLKKIFPHATIEEEYHVGQQLRLDLYIGKPYYIAFEYDGIQHFKYTPGLHKTEKDFEKSLKRDKEKELLCKKRGISLIRIKYSDTLTLDFLQDKINSAGYGTGIIQEDALTNKEHFKKKQIEINKQLARQRKEVYNKFKQSDIYKKAQEQKKKYQREQYRRLKEWKKQNIS